MAVLLSVAVKLSATQPESSTPVRKMVVPSPPAQVGQIMAGPSLGLAGSKLAQALLVALMTHCGSMQKSYAFVCTKSCEPPAGLSGCSASVSPRSRLVLNWTVSVEAEAVQLASVGPVKAPAPP